MTPEYRIPVVCGEPDWSRVEKAPIACYKWGRDYMPVSYAQCAFLPDRGLAVKLTSYESAPKAVYGTYGSPVYKDSCLEFFASFDPRSAKYMNFEMNSNGAYLSSVRTDKTDKKPIDALTDELPDVKCEKGDGFWSVEVLFTAKFISDCFDETVLAPGSVFRGNFYKCGDETDIPHYGSWAPIDNPTPSFHLPAFFGTLVIDG